MLSLARDGYTAAEILDTLYGKKGFRKERFRYDLLDKNDKKKQTLTSVIGGEVSFAAYNDIKRTAKFKIKDDSSIDWLSDRIQPFYELYMPHRNKWISFPLGVFVLSSPIIADTISGVIRDVEAYDGTVTLMDDKFDDIYTVTEGTNYKTAVINILQSAGITKYTIEDTEKVLPISKQFDLGMDKLTAVNSLLSAINFRPITVDVNGFFRSEKYIIPRARAIEQTYKDDHLSVTVRGMSIEVDLFNTPNKWVVVRTNSEQPPLKSVYINSDPSSPTSTVNRGRTIVEYREIYDIADQAALDAYTEIIANNTLETHGKLMFSTAIMPHHDYFDILKIEYSPLDIHRRYLETAWTIPLQVGGIMTHEARKVVEA